MLHHLLSCQAMHTSCMHAAYAVATWSMGCVVPEHVALRFCSLQGRGIDAQCVFEVAKQMRAEQPPPAQALVRALAWCILHDKMTGLTLD